MANQRARNKKVISVPLTEEVLRAIEREAKRRGTDRVKIINEVLKAALKIPLWALVALLASWSAKSPGSWVRQNEMLSLRAGILILLLAMLAATLTGAAVRYYRRGLLPWDFGRIAGHGTTLAGGG
jgi:hypothetical protein